MTAETLLTEGRSYSTWGKLDVGDDILHAIVDLTKFGPTSANCSLARFVFVRSPEAKKLLEPCLAPTNVDVAMKAPVNVIIGMDMQFYDHLPRLFPEADARSWFAGKPAVIETTAFRNSTLQGAYFMIAARMKGLDVGPISGFDNVKVDDAFFAGTPVRSNFIVNLGYGDPAGLTPRTPRFSFEDVARII